MPKEGNPTLFEFAPVQSRAVVAAFDGGTITSDAGGLLLGARDRAIGLVARFATCFSDHRCESHSVTNHRHLSQPMLAGSRARPVICIVNFGVNPAFAVRCRIR
jgi:hypothetical protein